MIEAIARLRKIAEECESRGRPDANTRRETAFQAEMMDEAARWHWLASEAAKLCQQRNAVSRIGVACAECLEKCLA